MLVLLSGYACVRQAIPGWVRAGCGAAVFGQTRGGVPKLVAPAAPLPWALMLQPCLVLPPCLRAVDLGLLDQPHEASIGAGGGGGGGLGVHLECAGSGGASFSPPHPTCVPSP